MKPGAPWSVKGIDPKARELAKAQAHAQGKSLGEWMTQMILTAPEDGAAPGAPPAPAEDAQEAAAGPAPVRQLAAPDRAAGGPPAAQPPTGPSGQQDPQIVDALIDLSRRLEQIEERMAAGTQTLSRDVAVLREGLQNLGREFVATRRHTIAQQDAILKRTEQAIAVAGAARSGVSALQGRLEDLPQLQGPAQPGRPQERTPPQLVDASRPDAPEPPAGRPVAQPSPPLPPQGARRDPAAAAPPPGGLPAAAPALHQSSAAFRSSAAEAAGTSPAPVVPGSSAAAAPPHPPSPQQAAPQRAAASGNAPGRAADESAARPTDQGEDAEYEIVEYELKEGEDPSDYAGSDEYEVVIAGEPAGTGPESPPAMTGPQQPEAGPQQPEAGPQQPEAEAPAAPPRGTATGGSDGAQQKGLPTLEAVEVPPRAAAAAGQDAPARSGRAGFGTQTGGRFRLPLGDRAGAATGTAPRLTVPDAPQDITAADRPGGLPPLHGADVAAPRVPDGSPAADTPVDPLLAAVDRRAGLAGQKSQRAPAFDMTWQKGFGQPPRPATDGAKPEGAKPEGDWEGQDSGRKGAGPSAALAIRSPESPPSPSPATPQSVAGATGEAGRDGAENAPSGPAAPGAGPTGQALAGQPSQGQSAGSPATGLSPGVMPEPEDSAGRRRRGFRAGKRAAGDRTGSRQASGTAHPVTQGPAATAQGPHGDGPQGPDSTFVPEGRSRRRRGMLLAVIALVLVAAGVGALAIMDSMTAPPGIDYVALDAERRAREAAADAPASTAAPAGIAGAPVADPGATPPATATMRPEATGAPAQDAGAGSDMAPAIEELRRASDGGSAQAAYELGLRLLDGIGVRRDAMAATVQFQRAADQGYAPAQFALGVAYQKGEGVPRDLEQAAYWYAVAADQGNPDAQFNFGTLYARGEGVEQDYYQAAKWYRRAADAGLSDAQFNFANMLETGLGVAQDREAAYRYYAMAAGAGDPVAAERERALATELGPATIARLQAAAADTETGDSGTALDGVAMSANGAPRAGLAPARSGRDGADQRRPDSGTTGTGAAMAEEGTGGSTGGADAPAASEAPPPPAPPARLTEPGQIAELQRLLNAVGFEAGPADGVLGSRTRTAISAFQEAAGLPADGVASRSLLLELQQIAATKP